MNKNVLPKILALQRAGQLAEARSLCLSLLNLFPDDVEILLISAQTELQAGVPETAIRLLDRALSKAPGSAAALYNRGVALQSIGRLDEALQSYSDAVAREPAHANAHYNRGVLLQQLGRNDDAVASYIAAAQAQPNYVDALFNLGLLLNQLKRFSEAVEAFDKALRLAPRDAAAWFNLGLSLYWGGNFARSCSAFDRALDLQPRSADARCARAMVLEALGRGMEALRDYQLAFQAGFRDAQAFARYGNLLLTFGRPLDATQALSIASQMEPMDADIFNSRGVALRKIGKSQEAMADFRRAIELKPQFIEAYANAADCAVSLGLVDDALIYLRLALNGEAKSASEIIARDRATSLNIFFRRQLCLWEGLEELEAKAADRIRDDGAACDPFKAVISYDDPQLHKLCADRLSATERTITPLVPRRSSKGSHKLRIAYMSADFHDHATTRLMAELFELHDRAQFEVVAYSYGHDDGSAMRKRVTEAFDRFNDVRRMSDREIAESIVADEVQILVDLKGHTRDARLDVLKYRPAPVQAHYIGFPGTLGGKLVDYMLADAVTVPFDQAAHYAEAIVHLPFCYQVNDRHRQVASATPDRSAYGLPKDAFVLCAFAQPFKLSPAVFDAWARILTGVPHGVLWLLSYNDEMQSNLRRQIEGRGIDADRLIFAAPEGLAQHLARHKLADLYLDTWPYGAHTSASDALWVGLPVLTRLGRSFASRVSASLLQAIGVPELISPDVDGYVSTAVNLARDPKRLSAIRERILRNRDSAPLFDTNLFRAGIEAAYQAMWEIHRRGEQPRHFSVAPSPERPNL